MFTLAPPPPQGPTDGQRSDSAVRPARGGFFWMARSNSAGGKPTEDRTMPFGEIALIAMLTCFSIVAGVAIVDLLIWIRGRD